ncbi:GspE/PulE family protein [Roseateles sp. LYH14W]|uniref:GspE/PulE family protein n=1 Tax=Pelomonas parva TaxID=3299032 RepID=A0ABW7FDH6_9BURK
MADTVPRSPDAAMTPQQLRAAIQSARQAHRSGAGTVWDVLLRSGAMPEADWKRLLHEAAGIRVVDAGGTHRVDFSKLPLEEARRLRAVPLSVEPGASSPVALADPWNDETLRTLAARLGGMPEPMAASAAVLDQWLGGDVRAPVTARQAVSSGPLGDGPVVQFVDSALRAAYAAGASDVHFECDRSGVTVKLRLDGVMSRHSRLDDVRRAEEVVSRIKVLAQLDITERRTPQDGRFRFTFDGTAVDLRVSIMPSVFGEDAVLRLLDKAQLRADRDHVSLDSLGFDEASAQRIRDLAGLPHGMLLVTGPTGSGKTTTVYAVLSEVNTGLEKIITIEDPVEYELQGVLQIPVNERKGLTFAKGLRSILRHDPDRILVGEIRDAETAEIAIQSALTGHQVFTTVHANSIFDVTGRFRHFGLDMFGFMSALNGVIVQRLVRRLCEACKSESPMTAPELRWLLSVTGEGVQADGLPGRCRRAVGCPQCRSTGYRGRFVLAEVHAVSDRLRDLVTGGAPLTELREHLHTQDTSFLASQGAQAVQQGRTSPEEIKRVVGWI